MAPLATGAFLFGPALNEPFHSPVMLSNSASFSVRHKTERFHWAHGRQLRQAPGTIAEEGKDI